MEEAEEHRVPDQGGRNGGGLRIRDDGPPEDLLQRHVNQERVEGEKSEQGGVGAGRKEGTGEDFFIGGRFHHPEAAQQEEDDQEARPDRPASSRPLPSKARADAVPVPEDQYRAEEVVSSDGRVDPTGRNKDGAHQDGDRDRQLPVHASILSLTPDGRLRSFFTGFTRQASNSAE